MPTSRSIAHGAGVALTLFLAGVEARAIPLPDTTSPCSTGSSDGCLKITNTDTTDYGAPSIVAVTQSPYGAAILANGSYYGVSATSGNVGVQATGTNTGLLASGTTAIQASGGVTGIDVQASTYGISSSASHYGVSGSASGDSGYGLYGTASSGTGTGVYATAPGNGYAVQALATPLGIGVNATGYVAIDAAGAYEGVNASGSYIGVSGVGNTSGVYGSSTAHGNGVYGVSTGTGTAIYGQNADPSGYAGYFDGRVYSTVSFTSSDARLKKDVAVLAYGLKDVSALRPVTYKWKDESRGDGRYIGFLAQDLQKVIPEVVERNSKTGFLSVNYSGVVPVLVKAIQEQQALIDRQSARIDQLEQRPIVSSMFCGGINVMVALGAVVGLVFTVMRRRKEREQGR